MLLELMIGTLGIETLRIDRVILHSLKQQLKELELQEHHENKGELIELL